MLNQQEFNQNHITPGGSPAVVFVHGAMGSSDNWAGNIVEIGKAGFRTYALDLLGHGDSVKPDNPDSYHIEKVYAHLEAWIEANSIGKPLNLVGHSLGAFLILNYALRNPGHVRRLILVNPLCSPDQLTAFYKFWRGMPEVSAKMLQAAPSQTLKPFMRWERDFTVNVTAEKIRMMANDFDRLHPFIFHSSASIWDLRPQLSALNIETLVIWGNKDKTLSPKSFRPLVDKLPMGKGMEMQNCGHTPHITEAKRFNRKVIEFFGE